MASHQRTPLSRRSQRAGGSTPKLQVVEGKCPFCGHKKLLESMRLLKCAKCKNKIDQWR